ncbi:DUF1963 domain-containing protein [Actinomadura mexicana]|uniref:Uncharacterized protein YwqG n=1 Tax=Actinomadura mexicana TaxID=134959 RepID=A0A238YW96_9ACTN|nr:YwqG family protein [Actinomadura mexicana]SNR75415.1 Uncharacterized protein YwqG [Actinomadura mexicana]
MDPFVPQYRRLRALFDSFLAPEITAILLPLIKPGLRLSARGEVPVHLGGTPQLPPDEPWPTWNGRPLDFLGAIDFAGFAGLPRVSGLPACRAAFYYATEIPRPWGDEPGQRDGWRVFTGALRPATPPPGTLSCPQTTLGAAPFLSLPSPQEAVVQRLEMVYDGVVPVYEQLHAAWTRHTCPDEAPAHQLGGWPTLVQRPLGPDCLYASTGRTLNSLNPPALTPDEQRAVEEWHLLLQLDSDDRLGWYWGDPGRIYFCNRRDTPLEQTWLTVQAA